EACIMGLKMALDMEINDLEVYGDSSLIIFQTRGEYRTKDAKLVPYHQHLIELARKFKQISFTYVPRNQNQFTDALATLASMFQITERVEIQPLKVCIEDEPTFCLNTKEVPKKEPWYANIKEFLQEGKYPENTSMKEQRTIRHLVAHFTLSGNTLHKKSFDT